MKPRILIVEDMVDNMDLFREVLLIAGYDVIPVTDGLTAVEMAFSERPDLILMDISLPGIDGHEATRRIRKIPGMAATPIVAVTAHAMPVDREAALAAGCSAYLAKPVSPRILMQVVAEQLRR